MLLSIDRILQLLAEGKSIQKIAELSGTEFETVCKIIEEARKLLANHEGIKSRKKILIRKKGSPNFEDNNQTNNLDTSNIE